MPGGAAPWDAASPTSGETGREPRLVPHFPAGRTNLPDRVIPNYDIINQTSLNVQAAIGNWFFKLEAVEPRPYRVAVSRQRSPDSNTRSTACSRAVWMWAFSWNTFTTDGIVPRRRPLSTTTSSQAHGSTSTNEQTTEVSVGGIINQETQATTLNLEASRRLGNHWKIELEARFFENVPHSDVALFGLSRDSYVQVNLQRFF